MSVYSQPKPLAGRHDVEAFDCGDEALDEFLKRHALVMQAAGGPRTFVVGRGERVVAYHSLAVASVSPLRAPARTAKGLGRHPIPVILLARLAVDRADQGKGLGAALLKDEMTRAVRVAEEAGVRALLVHAKDRSAAAFYAHFDFESSPTDPLHLFLLMKDIRARLER